MRIESMRIRSYRSFRVDDADLPAGARERLSAIRRFDGLRTAGCAERANRTARIEFWNLLDCDLTVEAVSRKLLKREFFHNYLRPHSAIDYRSPNEYLVACEAAQPQCQMS